MAWVSGEAFNESVDGRCCLPSSSPRSRTLGTTPLICDATQPETPPGGVLREDKARGKATDRAHTVHADVFQNSTGIEK